MKPGISISDPDDSCKNIRLDRFDYTIIVIFISVCFILCVFNSNDIFNVNSSSSSDEDDDGSSTSDNQDAQSEKSLETASVRLQSSLSASLGNHRTTTLTPNHSKSLSTPHTGQNIQVHPVMKSSSNPAVDKQAMGINSGKV